MFVQKIEGDASVLFDKIIQEFGEPEKYAYPKKAVWRFYIKEKLEGAVSYQEDEIVLTLDSISQKLHCEIHNCGAWGGYWTFEEDVVKCLREDLMEWVLENRKQEKNKPQTYNYTQPLYINSTDSAYIPTTYTNTNIAYPRLTTTNVPYIPYIP